MTLILSSIGQRVKNFDGEAMDLIGIKRTHNLLHGPNVKFLFYCYLEIFFSIHELF